MNRILLQVWEVSERGLSTFRDGCSLHIDEDERLRFVSGIYSERQGIKVPEEYDRVVGVAVEAYVDDEIFEKVVSLGSVRLPETSMSNLLSLGEIIIKDSI